MLMLHDTTPPELHEILKEQREYFFSGETRDISWRILQLKKLRDAIRENEKIIASALWADLHKSYEECWLTEISLVLQEINLHLKNLKKWSRNKPVQTHLRLRPSSSEIMYEPLGVCLILAPWNYPFQLLINPLIGAISAGCCAIVKPSPDTPNVASIIQQLLERIFVKGHVAVIHGGRNVNEWLFREKFDLIFFTGSTTVGKIVMEAASKNLTPVILELGGKTPCIVDEDADIKVAARRIVWGKTINAGQTCIAPDYLLVHKSKNEELIRELKEAVTEMFGTAVRNSPYYGRIVNDIAFKRLASLLKTGKIEWGGETEEKERFISPTLISGITMQDAIMQQEIFGPLLPLLTFNHIDEAIQIVRSGEKPLALYFFGKKKSANKILAETSSGGACINDTLVHIANHELPFGGVGASGFGKYHGRESFLSFSNQKPVVKTPTWVDLMFRYPPFKYFSFTKKFT